VTLSAVSVAGTRALGAKVGISLSYGTMMGAE